MGNFFVNIKSTIVIMSNNVKSLLSWATTIGAATMALLGNTLIHDSLVGVGIYDSLEKSLSTLVIVSLVLIIAYIIILFFVTLYKVYSGRLTTTIFKDRKITILNGDVHQNFLYTIDSNDFKKNYNEYIFIYPISMNGRADRTWPNYTFTHNDIIISNCINYVANLHQYKNLVMYLVGVHDYGMHLLNVFVSVINIFASIFTRYKQSGKGFVIKELTISCQKEDVDQWGVSFGQLEKYANTVSSYYKFK